MNYIVCYIRYVLVSKKDIIPNQHTEELNVWMMSTRANSLYISSYNDEGYV